jgi:integrase
LTDYRHTADRIIRDLGELRLEDVTPELLERWKATLTVSNRTVAKYLVILHGIFKRAMKVWRLPRNPAAGVERPRYRVSDDLDAFSPEEVWALVRAASSEKDGALFLTAAFSRLRMGELLALEWRDVDFSGDVIRVRRSYNAPGGLGTPKSGKVRSVPMVPDVAQALASLTSRADFTGGKDLVFPRGIAAAGDEPAPFEPLSGGCTSTSAARSPSSNTGAANAETDDETAHGLSLATPAVGNDGRATEMP